MRKAASALTLAALLLGAGVTEAPAVAFNTVDGIGTCLINACATGFVAIMPHPAWTPNIGLPAPSNGPIWISYADTGVGGAVPANTTTAGPPTETFQMNIPAGFASLSLSLWADDSVGVRLDNGGAYLLAPAPGGNMFGGTGTLLVIPGLGGTAHTIEFDTFQLGGDVFGLMVQGDLTPVPEPATLLLVGSTLAAVGVVSRRRLHRKQELSY
jgi:hypothetical protein